MSQTIRGTIERTYHSSPKFSAGVLESDDGQCVRFAGKFCANVGDVVALVGHWKNDPKFGRQFAVESLCYELPDTSEGLVQYLAKHPAFTGIGEATARKIVTHAASSANLDRLIRHDVHELHRALRIPKGILENLREAWLASSAENEVRTYLAGFGLTPHQTDTLLERYGNAIVGVLRADPYQLIQAVKGYGFKKVDKIARAMGTPKNHPGRIAAGIIYCLNEEVGDGHTWTAGSSLLDKANDLLLLDTVDSRTVIEAAAQQLLTDGQIVADGSAVTTAFFLEAERFIHATFVDHGRVESTLATADFAPADLNPDQRAAYHNALRHRISVITGGAGTGKTFVVARLTDTFQSCGLRVALCAPTGKATKRIEELLRQEGLDQEARTIHRLLEYDGTQFNRASLSVGAERIDADGQTITEPAYDVVIVDEVSMVDVPLMAELLRRIDLTQTRLILVGDHNQLPPVGPGNVLRDIVEHAFVPTVVLTRVERQAGVLKANSTAVLSGAVMPTAAGDHGWTVVDVFQEADQIQVYLRDLVTKTLPQRLGLDPIRDVQIITPTHLGLLGTRAINQMMQCLHHGQVHGRFAEGDKVIQTANDYGLGVMNGTIGYVTEVDAKGYGVTFDGEGYRFIDGERLGNLHLAYALTAHKAQGSEFPCAVVLCHRSHFFADRNWLYTAVTRAARHCVLVGDKWGLAHAAKKNNVIHRRTFLSLWSKGTGDSTATSAPALEEAYA